jgi:uncharacterized protein (DUF58 family)
MVLFSRPRREAAPERPAPLLAPPQLLRRLSWSALRPLATLLGGDERSRLRGFGLELDDLRPYQPGDDVRRIHWGVTARFDEPFVTQSRSERALDVWFVVDLSASMAWGTAQCVKRQRLEEFLAAGSQLLGRRGHRLGALLFADRLLEVVPPKSGRSSLVRLLQRVHAASAPAGGAAPDLGAVLRHAGAVVRRPAFIILVSDFLVPEGWGTVLSQLALRHEVVAVQIGDPRESDLPDVGLVVLEDPETGRQLLVDTADAGLRERYRQAAAAQAACLRALFVRSGVEHLCLTTADEILPALIKMLHTRRQRRAQRAVPRAA